MLLVYSSSYLASCFEYYLFKVILVLASFTDAFWVEASLAIAYPVVVLGVLSFLDVFLHFTFPSYSFFTNVIDEEEF